MKDWVTSSPVRIKQKEKTEEVPVEEVQEEVIEEVEDDSDESTT